MGSFLSPVPTPSHTASPAVVPESHALGDRPGTLNISHPAPAPTTLNPTLSQACLWTVPSHFPGRGPRIRQAASCLATVKPLAWESLRRVDSGGCAGLRGDLVDWKGHAVSEVSARGCGKGSRSPVMQNLNSLVFQRADV